MTAVDALQAILRSRDAATAVHDALLRSGYRIVPTDDPICEAAGCSNLALLDPAHKFCRAHRRPE